MRAQKHPLEEERIGELRALGVLDTEPELRFDDLTELAAQVCDAPIALITLIAEDRQWFKSHFGTDVCGTELAASTCAHTILGTGPLVIEDMSADPRTADNLAVREGFGLEFYAGVPLIGRAGLPYGTLCIHDTAPRTLSSQQLVGLQRLARQAVIQLELSTTLRRSEENVAALHETQISLRAALKQTEILRDEIDHRVKNSLSQVAALLRIQAAQSNQPAVKDALDVAQRRVATIASVHRELNRSAVDREVSLSDYISNLVDDLRSVLPDGIELSHDVPPLRIGTRHATPMAIVINECVANAVKYAFEDRSTGKIMIKATREGDQLVFDMSDDGVGMSAGTAGVGLGTKIIGAAAQSLDAEAEYPDVTSGHVLRLRIPLATLATL